MTFCRHLCRTVLLVACGLWLVGGASAWADEPVDLAAVPTPEALPRHVEFGLTTGLPAALGTGLSSGIVVGAQHAGTLTWGMRAAYTQATEYTTIWAVTHREIHLRVVGGLQAALGRGSVGVRLGAGATVLYESRARAQAARLGDAATGLDTSAWSLLPGAELEAFVALPIVAGVGLGLSAGPSLHLFQGSVTPGWLAQLTAVWWP